MAQVLVVDRVLEEVSVMEEEEVSDMEEEPGGIYRHLKQQPL